MKQFLTIFGFSLLSRVTARCQHGYGCGDDGECIDGYQLDIMFETTCQDIKECLSDSHGCDHECVEIQGSYECRCNDGYVLDDGGHQCLDIDECSMDGHGCENCVNLMGSYECTCDPGFELLRSNGCRDINECLKNFDTNQYIHNCTDNSQCRNTEGSYECKCVKGYTKPIGAEDGLNCVDLDECETDAHRCTIQKESDNDNVECINVDGDYECKCPANYDLYRERYCYYIIPEPTEPAETTQTTATPAESTTPYILAVSSTTPWNMETSSLDTTSSEEESSSKIAMYIWVLILVGVAVVVIVIVVAAIIFCKKNKEVKSTRGMRSNKRLLDVTDLDSPQDEQVIAIEQYAEKQYGLSSSQDSFETLGSSQGSTFCQPTLSKFKTIDKRNESIQQATDYGSPIDYSTLPPPPSSMTGAQFTIDDGPSIIRGAQLGSVIQNPNYPSVVPISGDPISGDP